MKRNYQIAILMAAVLVVTACIGGETGVQPLCNSYSNKVEYRDLSGIFHDIDGKGLTIHDVINGRAYIGISTNGEFCISEYKTFSWDEWKQLMDDYAVYEKTMKKTKTPNREEIEKEIREAVGEILERHFGE